MGKRIVKKIGYIVNPKWVNNYFNIKNIPSQFDVNQYINFLKEKKKENEILIDLIILGLNDYNNDKITTTDFIEEIDNNLFFQTLSHFKLNRYNNMIDLEEYIIKNQKENYKEEILYLNKPLYPDCFLLRENGEIIKTGQKKQVDFLIDNELVSIGVSYEIYFLCEYLNIFKKDHDYLSFCRIFNSAIITKWE